jgi:hypothetical protein
MTFKTSNLWYSVTLSDRIANDSTAHTQTHTFSITFELIDAPAQADLAPEPASLAIWGGLGLMGLISARRRKKIAV